MSPDGRRARVAAALLVAGLLGGSAGAFAYTEHLKLERSPVLRTHVGKLLGPRCECQFRRIPIQFVTRKPDRLSVVVVDSDGNVVRTLLASTPRPAGPQRFVWDGRDDSGHVVAAGTYNPRLHLANEHRTILMPNPITVDPVRPTIALVSLAPRVFSPGAGFRHHVVLVRYRTSEPARALLYVNGQPKPSVTWRPYHESGVMTWRGTGLAPGRYRLVLRALDLAGNLSAPVPIGVVRIRYIEVRPHVLHARAGTRIGFRVVADARHFEWRFAGRQGTSRPGLLVLRARRSGRFHLIVSANGHGATALVIVRPRG
jgi:FlgD Ig-like domain